MWYRKAQQGFGGGFISPVELKIQQALSGASKPAENPEPVSSETNIPQNPISESTDDYEKRIWDTLVNRTDSITPDSPAISPDGSLANDGPGTEAIEARRLSPYHQNPEETTMEEQLEALRQQNVNSDQSMSSTDGSRGNELVRGEFAHASGKGWNGYEDLPSNKSWA